MNWKGMPNWAELDKRRDFIGDTLNERDGREISTS